MPEKPWLRHYDPNVPHRLDCPDTDVYSQLTQHAEEYADRTAIWFMGKTLSYAELFRLARRLAGALSARGIGPGDRVVILLPNCPQFIIAYLALMRLGAVGVLVNPLNVARELRFKCQDSGARAIIALDLMSQKINQIRGEVKPDLIVYTGLQEFLPFPLNVIYPWKRRLDRKMPAVRLSKDAHTLRFQRLLAEDNPPPPRPDLDPQSMAVLLYTGGTTGVSKGIMLSHKAVIANYLQARAWVGVKKDDAFLAVLPLFHGFGMSICMNAPLAHGGRVILVPRFDAADLVKTIAKTRPTLFAGVPSMFIAIKELPYIRKRDLTCFRGIFVGAAPLPLAVMQEFEAMTGANLIEGYGLTESVTAMACNPYLGLKKPGTVGIPFPDMDWRIMDLETGTQVLPPGVTGEIVLRGPTLMTGYYRQEEKTAEAIRDGWLFTGDIGHMDQDGYVTIVDRKKDLIIVSGFNVYPSEIDEVLHTHPKVSEGVAVGLPHTRKGQTIKAYVVPKAGQTIEPDEIREFCRENLSPFMVPSMVEVRQSLPKSLIGKVLRRELVEEEARKS